MRTLSDFDLEFPRAYGATTATADFRCEPEDFQVVERLGFAPVGEGEHVFLWVEKRGENTAWVAKAIAQVAGVKEQDVGYAGRKDRHALTRQWFSVYLPLRAGQGEPDWQQLNSPSIAVQQVVRHTRKLRPGDHEANSFVIRLRHVCGEQAQITQRFEQLVAGGVPNYFGEQRFGNHGANLLEAEQLLFGGRRYTNTSKRGLMLSAARSYLFNRVLAGRVQRGDWQQVVAGEPCEYASGPLWGRGRSLAGDKLLAWETEQLSAWADWCDALEHKGLQQERRPLVLTLQEPAFSWVAPDQVELSFTLTTGAFATAVLQELVQLRNGQPAATSDAGD